MKTQIIICFLTIQLLNAADTQVINFINLPQTGYKVCYYYNEKLDKNTNVGSMIALNDWDIAVNGSFYSADLAPDGYFKNNGNVISSKESNKLSAALCVDDSGKFDIVEFKSVDKTKYNSIIQAGPFIIDPGGKVGIHKDNDVKANRSAIGMSNDGNIILAYSPSVSLFELAISIVKSRKDIDRMVCLDGGAMAGIWSKSKDYQIKINSAPTINYIGFISKGSNESLHRTTK